MSETKKESEVGLLIKEFEDYQKVFWSFPKSLRNSKIFGKSRSPRRPFRLGHVERGLVSIFALSIFMDGCLI